MRRGLFIGVTIITLLFAPFRASYAETVNYIYDELNRLMRVEYGNGVVIEYEYDKAGNRLEKMSGIGTDTTPPVGTVTINGGAAFTNTTGVTLTLTCSDAEWGCVKMQFSSGGSYSPEEWYATSKSWTLTSGDGPKTVWARFRDGAGNWSSDPPPSDSIQLDTIAPVTSPSPPGGTWNYSTTVYVTLGCSDTGGSGCEKICYTTDGTDPTPCTQQYTDPIAIPFTQTLKFFARDFAGNNEAIHNEFYNIGPVRIGVINYRTLQMAYTAAINGDIIKCRDLVLWDNLTVNRDISVTLEGGYNADFTSNYGTMTHLRGMITTTAGGGTLTIKNFTLETN
jgi:YD repeat-containing protein